MPSDRLVGQFETVIHRFEDLLEMFLLDDQRRGDEQRSLLAAGRDQDTGILDPGRDL